MIVSSMSYASLAQLLDNTAGTEPTDATELATYYARVYEFGVRASRVIDQLKHFSFAPFVATRYASAWNAGPYELVLDYPLLSLTSLTLADTSTPTVTTEVRGWPRTESPYLTLQSITSAVTFHALSSTLDQDIAITGIWGWHSDYPHAWIDSGDAVKTDALTAVATTVKVDDVDGTGGDGTGPRFSAGQLIRIDSEYMAITATVASTTNTLTVVRGERGSTAATHEVGADIYVFQPDPAITRAVMLWASVAYGRRGMSDRIAWDTQQAVPNTWDIPVEVQAILDTYQWVWGGSA